MPKEKIVFISGNFNIFHPGHLRLFRFAKEIGNKLVIGVVSDRIAEELALINQEFRLEAIKNNLLVDEAFLLDESLEDCLLRIKPDFVVKGKEYEYKSNPEEAILKRYGGKLIFSSGETAFTSDDLIRGEINNVKKLPIALPDMYMSRHSINRDRLIELVTKFSKVRLCVLGDLIIDEYIDCEPLGLSQEEPTIVVTPVNYMKFIGGAGIVAAHAAGLNANSSLISIVGNDPTSEYAKLQLKNYGVSAKLLADESRPTTLKQRFRSKEKGLLRVSYLHQEEISERLQLEIIENIESMIKNLDLIIFSDFNYGCLPQKLVEKIIDISKKNNVMLSADSQSSSQIGDIGRFKQMNLIAPTEREARISIRDNNNGLVVVAEKLMEYSRADNILMKMGADGLLVHAGSSGDKWVTERIEALNSSIKDVSGAGDSLLIASSLTLAAGGTIWEAACLGSIAAAIQVSRVGNTPLTINEIIDACIS